MRRSVLKRNKKNRGWMDVMKPHLTNEFMKFLGVISHMSNKNGEVDDGEIEIIPFVIKLSRYFVVSVQFQSHEDPG
jgi:hypothetical protein